MFHNRYTTGTVQSRSVISWGDDEIDHDDKSRFIAIRKLMFVLGFSVGAYTQVSSIGIILQLRHLYVMGFWSVTALEGVLILLSKGVLELLHKIMAVFLENEQDGAREMIHEEARKLFTRGWLIGSAVLSTLSFFVLRSRLRMLDG